MPGSLFGADVDARFRSVRASTIVADTITGLTRDQMPQEDFVGYPIPLSSVRVHDNMAALLPAAAADDDMGLVTGTPGTDDLTLQGVDFGATSSDEKCAFQWRLPIEYQAGQSVRLRVHAGILTTVADGALTLDVECWRSDGEGSVGSDLYAGSAADINDTTTADQDFTIDAATLSPGDLLIFRLSFAGSDTGNAGVMIPLITRIEPQVDIKG
jgi:hypothetical protein